jgi:hypothetical protein
MNQGNKFTDHAIITCTELDLDEHNESEGIVGKIN